MTSRSPSTIGPHKIERELGRGGMGVVYLALDTGLDRQVAIKALPADLGADPDRLIRFEREAKVLAALNHPNVGGIYGLEQADGHPYLVLEYVDGITLSARLKRGALPVDEALQIAKQIAEALEAAHEKGIVHRDLKPGNVMVTADGVIKVLDFGLARAAVGAASSAHAAALADSPTLTLPSDRSPTIPGVVMGTAGYMSPEQARGKPVDKRSDIFSFGCVLYEMLTGAQTFPGETVADSVGAILHREPDWTNLPANTPLRIRELLTSCLAKDRKNRLRDIGDARLALERSIAGSEWSARDADPAHSADPWRRAAWTLAVALVGIAVGVAATRWQTSARDPRPAEAGVLRLSVAVPQGLSPRANSGHGEPMLTPDGRCLCYIATEALDGRTTARLYRRRLSDATATVLPGTEDTATAAMSPDGQRIVFIAAPSDARLPAWIGSVPLDGATPPTHILALNHRRGLKPSLSCLPGGDVLYARTGEWSVTRVSSASGAESHIPIVSETTYDQLDLGPVLPGGEAVLATAIRFSNPYAADAAVFELASGRLTILMPGSFPHFAQSGHVIATVRDSIVAAPFDVSTRRLTGPPVGVIAGVRAEQGIDAAFCTISDNGTLAFIPGAKTGKSRRLVWITERGEVVPWSEELRAIQGELAVSADGRRIAVTIMSAEATYETWGAEIGANSLHALLRRKGHDVMVPILSPDGARVGHTVRPGADESSVCIGPFDRSGEARTIFTDRTDVTQFRTAAWLPDGSGVVVQRNTAQGPRLFVAPIERAPDATGDLAPLFATDSDCKHLSFSYDNSFLAYVSTESGGPEVYVRAIEKGTFSPPIRASRAGGIKPIWSGDSKTLYFSTPGRGAALMVRVTKTPALAVSQPQPSPLSQDRIESLDVLEYVGVPGAVHPFLAVQRGADEKPADRFDLMFNFFDLLNEKAPPMR